MSQWTSEVSFKMLSCVAHANFFCQDLADNSTPAISHSLEFYITIKRLARTHKCIFKESSPSNIYNIYSSAQQKPMVLHFLDVVVLQIFVQDLVLSRFLVLI